MGVKCTKEACDRGHDLGGAFARYMLFLSEDDHERECRKLVRDGPDGPGIVG